LSCCVTCVKSTRIWTPRSDSLPGQGLVWSGKRDAKIPVGSSIDYKTTHREAGGRAFHEDAIKVLAGLLRRPRLRQNDDSGSTEELA
jgi:hypothetical protein